MAGIAARGSFLRRISINSWLNSSQKVLATGKIQVATLKATYGAPYPYPDPWPYKEKKLTWWRELMDVSARDRLNENSKVIVVEGNIGVGKNEFAKALAKQFDLVYVPSVHDDAVFINNCFDRDERMLDHFVSDEAKCYDIKRFLADPNPEKGYISRLQLPYLLVKYIAYANALLHLLHTGQGFVMARSPYSDEVFVAALRKLGWITKGYHQFYQEIMEAVNAELLHPHITMYLDAPIEKCMDRIKARKDPREVGAEGKFKKLLPAVEESFKSPEWRKVQRRYGEFIEIDWTEIGTQSDMDALAEELENYVLENEDFDDLKFREWKIEDEDTLADLRERYGSHRFVTNLVNNGIPWDHEEAYLSQDAVFEREYIMQRHPLFKYVHSPESDGKDLRWSFS